MTMALSLAAALLTYPQIDPVILQLGPLGIRWYSVAYIAGILLGCFYLRYLDKRCRLTPLLAPTQYDDLVVWAIGGVILGGRLGYVLFYQPAHYLTHPLEILMVWHGGMSFHGGALGVISAFWLYARKYGIPYVTLMDMVCCCVPIGLFFGRLANFINGELFGRATSVPWAMIFPAGGPEPRHPSQLYEAGLEGLSLFLILFLVARLDRFRRIGLCSGLFLLGYGLSRFALEFVRQPDANLGEVLGPFSMGQLLSTPMLLVGLFLILRSLFPRQKAVSLTSVN